MTSSRTSISSSAQAVSPFLFSGCHFEQSLKYSNGRNQNKSSHCPVHFQPCVGCTGCFKKQELVVFFPKGLRMRHCVHVLQFIYSANLLGHSWTKCLYSTEDMAVSKQVKDSPWVHARVCAIVCVFFPSTHLMGCLMRTAMWHFIVLTLAMKGTGS